MNYIPITAVCEKLRARLDAIDDVEMHCSQPMKMSSMKGPFVFVRMYLYLNPRPEGDTLSLLEEVVQLQFARTLMEEDVRQHLTCENGTQRLDLLTTQQLCETIFRKDDVQVGSLLIATFGYIDDEAVHSW